MLLKCHPSRCFEWLVDLVVRNNSTRRWGSKFKKATTETEGLTEAQAKAKAKTEAETQEAELHRIREELQDIGIRVGINNGELDMSTGKIEIRYSGVQSFHLKLLLTS